MKKKKEDSAGTDERCLVHVASRGGMRQNNGSETAPQPSADTAKPVATAEAEQPIEIVWSNNFNAPESEENHGAAEDRGKIQRQNQERSNSNARAGRRNSMFCLPPDKFRTFSRSMRMKPIWPYGRIRASLPAFPGMKSKRTCRII